MASREMLSPEGRESCKASAEPDAIRDMEKVMHKTMIIRHTTRCGLLLAVCISMLSIAPKSRAGPQQIAAPAGTAAADQAFREVAASNYAGAIRDFQKALAADPMNSDWRKALGFADLAAGFPEDAAAEFKQVYAKHPEDFGLALQLGYVSLQLHRNEEAEKYFQIVAQGAGPELSATARKELAALQASQLSDRKQRGYDLLAQHRDNDAIQVFEAVHGDDPSDVSVVLQLGYLYAAAGRAAEARKMFSSAEVDADPKIAAQGAAGLATLRRDTKPWFATFYAAPFYQSRFSNEINPANAELGWRPSRYFEPYLGVRFNRDVRSQAGTLPQIYSDNSVVFSVGVQSNLANTGIVVYAEAGTAVHLTSERPRARSDYRVGAVWSRAWGTELFSPAAAGRSVSLTGSAYADAGFYSRYDRNVIGNVQLREGIDLPTSRVLPMQLLAGVNLVKDSNGDFYNNIVEVGPVLRIAPLRHVPSLAIEAQYMRGFYYIHDPTNPYGPRYGDFRLFLIWSKMF